MVTAPTPGLPESQQRAPLWADQADGSSPPLPAPAPVLHCRPGDAEHQSASAESRCPTLPGPLVAKLEAALQPGARGAGRRPRAPGWGELGGLHACWPGSGPTSAGGPGSLGSVQQAPQGNSGWGDPPHSSGSSFQRQRTCPHLLAAGSRIHFLNICSVPGAGLDRGETGCSPCLMELSLARAQTSKKEVTGGGNKSHN